MGVSQYFPERTTELRSSIAMEAAEQDTLPEWMTCHADVFISVWLPKFESGELRRDDLAPQPEGQAKPSSAPAKRKCSVDGCNRYAAAGHNGMCISHGKSAQYVACSVPGCDKWARKDGVCKRHQHLAKPVTPRTPAPIKPCACGKPANKKKAGMCNSCYGKWYREQKRTANQLSKERA